VRQCVVLGAGLDTFAHRNPYADLTVFEVDRPKTQVWKRTLLATAGLAPPPNLRFAPVDFESGELGAGLSAAGFHADEPAWFSWLGVSMYMVDAAFERTLAFVAACPAGSGVVFDYALPPGTLDEHARRAFDAMAERVAAAGEPWLGFHAPDALARRLAALGFRETEDLGPDAIHARWFADRADGLRTGGAAHLAVART
jgi:methyltransferase (TIGR00027 family)